MIRLVDDIGLTSTGINKAAVMTYILVCGLFLLSVRLCMGV